MRVQAPIGQGIANLLPAYGRVVRLASLVVHALNGHVLLKLREPVRMLRVVGQEEEDEEGREAGRDSLDDEEPAPAGETSGAVHVTNTVGDCATELGVVSMTVGQRRVRTLTAPAKVADAKMNATLSLISNWRRDHIQYALPNTALIMLIPKSKIIHEPREEPGLKHAEQESHRRHSPEIVRPAESHRHAAPAQHEKGEPPARAELLKEEIAGDLKGGVGDEKDHEGDDELVVGHGCLGLHVVVGARV